MAQEALVKLRGNSGMFSLFFIVNHLTSTECSGDLVRFIVWASGDPLLDQSITAALIPINL